MQQYIQASLEVPWHTHEPFLERIVQQFAFSLREDIIFYDDFAQTKMYLINGREEHYAELKAIGEKLGYRISKKVSIA